jgi:pimeloyl-ACP methyl ester carboxylesterase
MAAAVTMPLPGTGRAPVPFGRRLELPRRGTTFVRELPGPPGAPTLLLLHGWVATGGLNWYHAFRPLAEHFRVIAPDVRGHGRGVRDRRIFRLADAADDCAEMLVELDTGPVIAVGYSMGGPISQLLWRRHRDLVEGLVFCATSAGFFPDRRSRLFFQSCMLATVGAARAGVRTRVLSALPVVPLPSSTLSLWAASEVRRHDWRMISEAGHSISTYSARRWIHEVDVPTAVVRTTEDRGVRSSLQLALADAIRGAHLFDVADGHLACGNAGFTPPLLAACNDVADRIR